LRVTGCGVRVTGCGVRVTGFELKVSGVRYFSGTRCQCSGVSIDRAETARSDAEH
jgi:hypothetical protein